MTFTAGAKLGPYEILTVIGEGGQDEVYKSRDTRLNRTVAIKVLSSHFRDNAEMKARFEPEALTMASSSSAFFLIDHVNAHQIALWFSFV